MAVRVLLSPTCTVAQRRPEEKRRGRYGCLKKMRLGRWASCGRRGSPEKAKMCQVPAGVRPPSDRKMLCGTHLEIGVKCTGRLPLPTLHAKLCKDVYRCSVGGAGRVRIKEKVGRGWNRLVRRIGLGGKLHGGSTKTT